MRYMTVINLCMLFSSLCWNICKNNCLFGWKQHILQLWATLMEGPTKWGRICSTFASTLYHHYCSDHECMPSWSYTFSVNSMTWSLGTDSTPVDIASGGRSWNHHLALNAHSILASTEICIFFLKDVVLLLTHLKSISWWQWQDVSSFIAFSLSLSVLIHFPQWTQLQFGLFSVPTSGPQLVYQRPWYVLFCLWKSAYKRSLAAYRKE